jgi:hypothetical protein
MEFPPGSLASDLVMRLQARWGGARAAAIHGRRRRIVCSLASGTSPAETSGLGATPRRTLGACSGSSSICSATDAQAPRLPIEILRRVGHSSIFSAIDTTTAGFTGRSFSRSFDISTGPRSVGATEVQEQVSQPRSCVDALVGAHRATGT